jgi:formylmethanofuran dehydrogenase subunit E
MTRPDLAAILHQAALGHHHLCPRQVLGARIGLAGLAALGWPEGAPAKALLVIAETDGCFLDALAAATGCSPGHRTLRVEDYGKVAATFLRLDDGRAVRVAPRAEARARAAAGSALPRWQAMLQGYQVLADAELLSVRPVRLRQDPAAIMSRPGIRARCARCGEEILNEREVARDGETLCRACGWGGYYREAEEPGD